jgi:hypothetical protein
VITPQEVAAKAARAYLPFLRAWLRGEPFTPLDIPAGAPPTDFRALEQVVAALLDGSRQRRGWGYTVELQTRVTRAHGTQSLPTRVRVASAEDLLHLIGKRAEFAAFEADVALIRATLPQLEGWLEEHVQRVIAHHGAWPELLMVCRYLLDHPRPGVYMRELPVAVHTKFVEQHTAILGRLLDALLPPEAIDQATTQFAPRYGLRDEEPLVRLRLLDPALAAQLGLPVDDLSAPLSQLARLPVHGQHCVVVENKLVFLTLPALPQTIAIFGSGFDTNKRLAKLPWLASCRLWYWGDLDAQGFQILSQLRASFPRAAALLMDAATFEAFREFAVPGTPCAVAELPYLTSEEQALFARLAVATLRLEQERISHVYARTRLQRAIAVPLEAH